MPPVYILRLTEAQAEMLRYALTLARRARRAAAKHFDLDGKRLTARLARDQARRISELRDLLDRCAPIDE